MRPLETEMIAPWTDAVPHKFCQKLPAGIGDDPDQGVSSWGAQRKSTGGWGGSLSKALELDRSA